MFPVTLTEYYADTWVWDNQNKSSEVVLSQDSMEAYFNIDPVNLSTGTSGVRGTRALGEGEHYWEVVFLEPPYGTSVMVGVGTKHAKLHTNNYEYVNLIGIDKESWGLSYKGTIFHEGQRRKYCDPIYDSNTVIGCLLNTYNGTLSYYQNGVSLGVAFCDSELMSGHLYPMISSTASETELALGRRFCKRSLSLRDKCCSIIRNRIPCKDQVDYLPLPNLVKRQILLS
ncbi:hypothetical protein LOTGIDRAFT_201570 [Lottia gigantea]|uniref:B30.2/SPRY domain-containing protein n=1 Tax=Lottia gigantea TaxID=225164 RepID=V4ANA2_LOTGI|nr:hypothetical protein LOTGIDRAFT_201570 [Lottia gigantea]ESO98637.1 hypothetical protein LOTGIDRAFT_201570 [Lottia gigantea]